MLDSRIEGRRPIPVTGLLLALAIAASGCIADETVLESTGNAAQLGSDGCGEPEAEGNAAEPTTGDTCTSSATCGAADVCSGTSVDCVDEESLVITRVSVLECPFDLVTLELATPPAADEPWVDCDAALNGGHTGQACGAHFTCGRIADACCAELASCGIEYPDLSSDGVTEPSQRLIRLRICTQDCQNLTLDESAVATDCATAYLQDDPFVVALGRTCNGDFVCVNGVDVRETGIPDGMDITESVEVAFCEGGVVLGRALQPPGLWPLL